MQFGMSSSPSSNWENRVAHINYFHANFLPTVIGLISEGVGKSRTDRSGEGR